MRILTTFVNLIALSMWTFVFFSICQHFWEPPNPNLVSIAFLAQLITTTEVVRITLGLLKGDALLGWAVALSRIFVFIFVFNESQVTAGLIPRPSFNTTNIPLTSDSILLAWSFTEVFRYPMILCSSSFRYHGFLKNLRYGVPLLTFPVGAVTEAYGCWSLLTHGTNSKLLDFFLYVIIANNLVAGFGLALPKMVKKAKKSFNEPSDYDKKLL